jgi:ankyrin repeat protein
MGFVCCQTHENLGIGAAVSVGGEGKVTTDLIKEICSNFLTVDPRGVVQLAYLSVREYLEVKHVEGHLIFSPEEAHAEAAITCLRYWIVVAKKLPVFEPGEDDDSEDDSYDDLDGIENDASSSWDSARGDADSEYQVEPTSDENPAVYRSDMGSKSSRSPSVTVAAEKSSWMGSVDTDTDAKIPAETEVKQRRELRNQEKRSESQEEVTTPEDQEDTPNHESNAQVAITIVTPSEIEDPSNASPYGPPNSDYFSQIDSYLKRDAAPSLKPHEAFKRLQRYASIYWATHCQAAKSARFDESRKLLWEFLVDNGSNLAFQEWATALLHEAKLASVPTIYPAPILFVPATAHERVILDAEPTHERWQQTIAYVDGPQRLMPTVALIACFWGFTDIIRGISEEGSAQMSRNHEGITGLVLAARNRHNEVLNVPISSSFDLDVPDNKGETMLHHAAIGGYVELARLLLGYPRELSGRDGKSVQKSRVNINAKGLGHRTPLHYAAELGQVEVIKLLLDEDNIDVHVRDAYGYTAIGLCLQNEEVAGLLRADRRYEKGDELSQAGLEFL